MKRQYIHSETCAINVMDHDNISFHHDETNRLCGFCCVQTDDSAHHPLESFSECDCEAKQPAPRHDDILVIEIGPNLDYVIFAVEPRLT
jgi:hypothetical protein